MSVLNDLWYYFEWGPQEETLSESPGGLADGSCFGKHSCQVQLIWPLFGEPGEPGFSPPVIISTNPCDFLCLTHANWLILQTGQWSRGLRRHGMPVWFPLAAWAIHWHVSWRQLAGALWLNQDIKFRNVVFGIDPQDCDAYQTNFWWGDQETSADGRGTTKQKKLLSFWETFYI